MGDNSIFIGSERFIEETRDASPANLLIKFETFSLFSQCGINKYESRAFEAGGYKWKMVIHPEEYESKDGESRVSVYFTIAETASLPVGWEVNAIFAFFLYNHHMGNYLCIRGTTRERFNALIPKCRFGDISMETLMDPSKGFFVDDSFMFGAEVFVLKSKSQCVTECLSLIKSSAPHKRDWKIQGFSKLENDWNSEEFVSGNHKWKVQLYPKGNSLHSKNRYVSIFLNCVDSKNFAPHRKVKAEVVMRIRGRYTHHHYYKFNRWFTSSSQNMGYSEFISIADLSSNGFLVDDCLFLEIEVSEQALVVDAPKI